MNRDRDEIEHGVLPRVAKPGRYVGNTHRVDSGGDFGGAEVASAGTTSGAATGDPSAAFRAADVRILVIHPDLFEPGFHAPVSVAAVAAAERCPGVFVDRAFLPWPDLATLLVARGTPLWGLRSFRSAADFDLVLFTPDTPLQAVSVVRLLTLLGLPTRAEGRTPDAPLLLATGDGVDNPAPLAPAFDLFAYGAPEVLLLSIIAALRGARGIAREERARRLARLPGLLSARGVSTPAASGAAVGAALPPANAEFDPPHAGMSLVEVDDDAFRLTIRRGGRRLRSLGGATNWLAPRHLEPEAAFPLVEAALRRYGLERVDLVGDDPAEHPGLGRLVEGLVRRHPGLRIQIDDYGRAQPDAALARELLRGKRSTFGWSPLAGSERLRAVLNRDFDEDRFLAAVATALRGGCHLLRLRFGIGWPSETAADVAALCDLVRRVRILGGQGGAPPRMQIQLEPFLPRPHSVFEREPLLSRAELAERLTEVRRRVEQGPLQVRHAPLERMALETSLLRGGESHFAALEAAAALGATPGHPGEPWDAAPWMAAWERAGIDPDSGTGTPEGALPWDAVELSLPRPERRAERERAFAGTPPSFAALAAAALTLVAEVSVERGPETEEDPAADVESRAFGRRGKRRTGPAPLLTSARFRLRFAKDAPVRFTAHLDVGRWFERALRRLDLSVGGGRQRSFKLSFGPPLPLGMTGEDEYLDLQFSEEVSEAYLEGLGRYLPPECRLLEARAVRSSVESLSQAVDRAEYRVSFPEALVAALPEDRRAGFFARLDATVDSALAATEIQVARGGEGAFVDVRPSLVAAALERSVPGSPTLNLKLQLTAPGGGRPELVLPALCGEPELDPRLARIHRVSLRITGAGREFTPLQVVEPEFPWWRDTMRRQSVGGRP